MSRTLSSCLKQLKPRSKLPPSTANVQLMDSPPIHEDWDAHLKDLLSSMFQKDPAKRAMIARIRVRSRATSTCTHTDEQEHDWVTEEGSHPMISRDDNLYHVGKHVDEPTQDELRCAVCSMRSILCVSC